MSAKTRETSLFPAITRREALRAMGGGLGMLGLSAGIVGYASAKDVRWEPWSPSRPWLPGERYEAVVPDTLDLCEFAERGLNAAMGEVDVEAPADGEIWIANILNANPPYMMHLYGTAGVLQPKVAEPVAALRVMTGSALNLDVEKMMVDWMVRGLSAEDGLLYSLAKPRRSWYDVDCDWVGNRSRGQVGTKSPGKPLVGGDSDYAYIYGQSRMMNFMMAYYQYTKDPAWKGRLDRMVDGIQNKMAIYKMDPTGRKSAYMPFGGGVNHNELGSCMPRSGWKASGREPGTESDSANEGSVFMDIGAHPGVLARWYAMSGNRRALELAEEFKNFMMQKKFWGTDKDPLGRERSAELGHWEGHFFGRMEALKGLLEYAVVTNDSALKEFVRNGYEWTKQSSFWPSLASFTSSDSKPMTPIPAIGFFDAHCGCTTPRAIALAIRLSDAGIGDYWEDVDRFIRNNGVEVQLRDPALLRKSVEAKPASITRPPIDSTDRVIERSIGSYPVSGTPTESLLPKFAFSGTCCMCHHNWGYYYAWEGIARWEDQGVARVNLLLDRASPWLDVDSYLPYEGKVVIRNKTAKTLFLRIPLWADKKSVRCRLNDRPINPDWSENYLKITGLAPNQTITTEFPMAERTEQYHGYTIRFKGNTVVDISPRQHTGGYPLYQRDYLKADKAPMKKVTRYVASNLIKW